MTPRYNHYLNVPKRKAQTQMISLPMPVIKLCVPSLVPSIVKNDVESRTNRFLHPATIRKIYSDKFKPKCTSRESRESRIESLKVTTIKKNNEKVCLFVTKYSTINLLLLGTRKLMLGQNSIL